MLRRMLLLCAAGGLLLSAAQVRAQLPPPPAVTELTWGASLEGRPITGTRIGDGPHKLFVVADTHGGPEANTFYLAQALQAHFRAHPEDVPAEVSLYIVPTINPDGLFHNTRFNASFVDLNRNMDTNFDACPENDWSQTVEGAYGYVSDTGGAFVESEPESQLVRDMLLDASGAIWLHSLGGDVFPAACEHAPSIALAQAYAAASGYRYDRFWGNYNITGGMHDWAGALGIASITPELATGELPEVAENLAAVQAVLREYDRLLPLPTPVVEPESGVTMPPLLWRFWRAHGGPDWFGPPVSPAVTINGQTTLFFEQTILSLPAEPADVGPPVQQADGGRAAWSAYLLEAAGSPYLIR